MGKIPSDLKKRAMEIVSRDVAGELRVLLTESRKDARRNRVIFVRLAEPAIASIAAHRIMRPGKIKPLSKHRRTEFTRSEICRSKFS